MIKFIAICSILISLISAGAPAKDVASQFSHMLRFENNLLAVKFTSQDIAHSLQARLINDIQYAICVNGHTNKVGYYLFIPDKRYIQINRITSVPYLLQYCEQDKLITIPSQLVSLYAKALEIRRHHQEPLARLPKAIAELNDLLKVGNVSQEKRIEHIYSLSHEDREFLMNRWATLEGAELRFFDLVPNVDLVTVRNRQLLGATAAKFRDSNFQGRMLLLFHEDMWKICVP